MKLRWIVITLIMALIVIGVFMLWPSSNSAQKKAVTETRALLRQQGFKTDLSEFDFSTPEEFRAREAALATRGNFIRPLIEPNEIGFMTAVAPDAALVLWKEEDLRTYTGGDFWTELREALNENRTSLDAASQAVLSGPIRFNLNASHGNGMLLPHLASLKIFIQTFGNRALLELHDKNKDAAWENLLASTRLVTTWQPEPVEISQLVRFSCATIAFNNTWQVLQANNWSDDQLAELQREWESVDFFSRLPETVAFARASAAAACQLERQRPMGAGVTFGQIFRYPASAWGSLKSYWRERHYRNVGTYEDEEGLLLHYRDQEIETALAVKSPTWAEMSQLPGARNQPFQSKYQSGMQTMMNMRRISMSFSGQGVGLLGKMATAEMRRRILLAAIALERYRVRTGSYPNTLAELSPDLLKNPPVDFADGKPLRYRRATDDHFVLYSIGLDCVDQGGEMPQRKRRGEPLKSPVGIGNQRELDLIWPRPASGNEAQIFSQNRLKEALAQMIDANEMQTEQWWHWTAKRQAQVERLLTTSNSPVREATFRGRSLSDLLRNTNTLGASPGNLGELLTPRQILTGEEPETATFEVPIAYDQLTNIADLELLIDCTDDDESDFGCRAGLVEVKRGQNGNCLLVWRTIFEPPGKHALQLGLGLKDPGENDDAIFGPRVPFTISNLCQISISSVYFDEKLGAAIHAKLLEPNGRYQIDLVTTNREHLKRFEGNTTNGVIKLHWDLKGDRGNPFTNHFFESIFHITLLDSGRTQTMKGP